MVEEKFLCHQLRDTYFGGKELLNVHAYCSKVHKSNHLFGLLNFSSDSELNLNTLLFIKEKKSISMIVIVGILPMVIGR